LDDGTLDLKYIEEAAMHLGLHLNMTKSESVCPENSTKAVMLSTFPELISTDPDNAVLLGSPIGIFLLLSQ
jgi:hypothetical protein